MTKEERIRRYEAIVRWGQEYLAGISKLCRDESLDSDRAILEEYEKGLTALSIQADV